MTEATGVVPGVYVGAAALGLAFLPPAPPEREDYLLGLKSTLARDADVVDVGCVGGTESRYALPYAVYRLRLRGAAGRAVFMLPAIV